MGANFQESKKVINNVWLQVSDDITTDWNILPFLRKFDFIKSHKASLALASVLSPSNPYVNPGNNGLIFFPLKGSMECSFYSFQPPIVDGRPHLPPGNSLKNEIKPLKTDVITLDRPTAINGLIPHSYELTGPFTFFVLKIPSDVKWDDVVDHIDNLKE
jgi:hypothetical protein